MVTIHRDVAREVEQFITDPPEIHEEDNHREWSRLFRVRKECSHCSGRSRNLQKTFLHRPASTLVESSLLSPPVAPSVAVPEITNSWRLGASARTHTS